MVIFGGLIPTVDAYYVDQVDGSDANTGTYDQPFLTVAHLASVDASANKSRWRFVVSSAAHPATQRQWREAVTVPRNNMVIDAWDPMGSGLKYLLDASDLVAAASWSVTAGQSNVYQVSVTLDPASGSSNYWVNAFENGTQLTRGSSSTLATAGTYFPSADFGAITLYVHLAADADPRSLADGWIEYTSRGFGLTTRNVTGVTVSGAWMRRNLHTDGSVVLGASCTLANSYVTQGSKHSCYVKRNATLTNVELLDGYWGSNGPSPLVLNDVWGAGDSIALNNVYSHFTIMPSIGNAFLAHGTGNLENLLVIDSQFMGPTGISVGQIARVTIRNTTVTAVTPGISLNSEFGGAVAVLDTVTIIGGSGAVRGITTGADAFESSPQSLNLTVFNSSITVAGNGSNCIFNVSAPLTLTVTGTTLSGQSGIVNVSTGGVLNANTLNLAGITGNYYYWSNAFTVTSDYNNFGAGTHNFNAAGTNKTLAQWKALGYDAHSTP